MHDKHPIAFQVTGEKCSNAEIERPKAGQDELVAVWNHARAMESCCCCCFLCSQLFCKCFYHLWSIIDTYRFQCAALEEVGSIPIIGDSVFTGG